MRKSFTSGIIFSMVLWSFLPLQAQHFKSHEKIESDAEKRISDNTTITQTSVNSGYSGFSVNIYPNPTSYLVHITNINQELHQIDILNLQGNIIRSYQPDAVHYTIDTSELPSGIYLLKMYHHDAFDIIKLVKN